MDWAKYEQNYNDNILNAMPYFSYKCHNVCYFRGGSKTPYRIRKYQNKTLSLKRNDYSDKDIINILRNRGYDPTIGFKVKRMFKTE